MLTTYFSRPATRTTYYAGPAGPYLDGFTHWLAQRGYRHESIRRRLAGAAQFVTWAHGTGCPLQAVSHATLGHFRRHLAQQHQLHRPGGQHSVRWLGAQCFVEFLQAQHIIAPTHISHDIANPALLDAFEQWMQVHRGVQTSTLCSYRPHVLVVLTALAASPAPWDVTQIRTAILTYARQRNPVLAKKRVTAWRMVLRFLSATGHCQPGLEAAIPSIASWRLATLPRYLPPEDIERVIAACPSTSARGLRDKAIVLLLARLGLRAGEVTGLRCDAMDWTQGTFCVMGKSRREAKLPLPQDVGDAILAYLETARPAVVSPFLFLTAIAPWTPITRYVVTSVAAHAIQRSGVKAPSLGAHVLRHSAATGLLRQGASLQVIGEVLRHRSVDTTAHYAKVDVAFLQQVTLPWPGAPGC
jgi:site-specific recombinase XerD